MCRLAAFPPGTTKRAAKKIIQEFVGHNTDGTGSVYVEEGKFVVNKWPISFKKVMKQKLPLLDHMPHTGWTLVHVRAASHGKVSLENTHPFILSGGNIAMVHNGIFSEHALAKALLNKSKFVSQTDSEVAGHLWQKLGPSKFRQVIGHSGVFMFLRKNGLLSVVCSSGDLEYKKTDHGILLASEFPFEYLNKKDVLEGYGRLNSKGEFMHNAFEQDDWKKNTYYYSDNKKKKGKKGKKDDTEYPRKNSYSYWKDDEYEGDDGYLDRLDRGIKDSDLYRGGKIKSVIWSRGKVVGTY